MPRELEGRRIFAVGELVGLLASELEAAFPDVWVEGEVSGFRKAASGHCYFSLKDDRAVLKVVLFRTHAQRLSFLPENGAVILARGKLSVFEGSGDLQLYATFLEPFGLGALQMALEQAKKRLMAEGLTDPARKRPIPPFPRRVGVVTSLEGAALRDLLSILRRRGALFDVVVSPALVQGATSAESLRRALRRLKGIPGVDVVLLTRGGGSLEDLWGFNDEALAREVAAFPVPVVSAVGHEVDTVLTDLTADLRAPTPSAAAELLTARVEEARLRVADARRRIPRLLEARLRALAGRLEACRPERLGNLLAGRLERAEQRRDFCEERLKRAAQERLRGAEQRLALALRAIAPDAVRRWLDGLSGRLGGARERLRTALLRRLQREEARLAAALRLLDALSPLKVLGRGYAAALDRTGRPVSDAAVLSPGDRLEVLLARGAALCTVTMTRPGSPASLLGLVDAGGEEAVQSAPVEDSRGREEKDPAL